jgi:hypothetical protein
MEYRVEIITPGGRRRYLEILYKYLKSQKADFDIWQLWVNTTDQEDIEYMLDLAAENHWIQCYECPVPVNGISTICHFFGDNTKREDTIYIRFDDDVVYLDPNFIRDFKEVRLKYRDPFFIYPNIVNNVCMSHIHQRNGLFEYPMNIHYDACDAVGWRDPRSTEVIHNTFIADVEAGQVEKWRRAFSLWRLTYGDHVSINSIAFFGYDMKTIERIGNPEEDDIAVHIPRATGRYNMVVGAPLCAHFAFYTQRPYLEREGGNVLRRYGELADRLLGI